MKELKPEQKSIVRIILIIILSEIVLNQLKRMATRKETSQSDIIKMTAGLITYLLQKVSFIVTLRIVMILSFQIQNFIIIYIQNLSQVMIYKNLLSMTMMQKLVIAITIYAIQKISIRLLSQI